MWKALAVQKLGEFAIGITVTAPILFVFPQFYYSAQTHIGIANAVAGAAFLWVMFFVAFLYAPLSVLVCAGLYAVGVRRAALLSAAGTVVFLADAAWVENGFTPQPLAFWIAWVVLGVAFFIVGLVVFRKLPNWSAG